MKKVIPFVVAAFCLSPSYANQGGNFGAGFVLGEPYGFTFKLWTVPQKIALDFGLGWGGGYDYNRYYYRNGRCIDPVFNGNNPNLCGRSSYGWQYFQLHADYLIHNFQAIRSTEKFPIYYGPGLFLDYWRGGFYLPNYSRNGGFTELGIRGVFGIAWIPHQSPFDVFVELAPVFAVFPGPDFRMNAGIGGRYWF